MQECLPPDRLPSHGRFRRFRYSYVAEINAGLAIQLSRKSEIDSRQRASKSKNQRHRKRSGEWTSSRRKRL